VPQHEGVFTTTACISSTPIPSYAFPFLFSFLSLTFSANKQRQKRESISVSQVSSSLFGAADFFFLSFFPLSIFS